jgi:hypothetical protein
MIQRRFTVALSCTTALLAASSAIATPAMARPARHPAASAALAHQYCPEAPVTRPFLAYGDHSTYRLAPGGDFRTAGWAFGGGAKLVAGAGPLVSGSTTSRAVSLPANSSVTSPVMCLDETEPTMRFFIQGSGLVVAQILVHSTAVAAETIQAGTRWTPSPIIQTHGKLLESIAGGPAQVSVRITGLSGEPRVSDIFIDPWNRG